VVRTAAIAARGPSRLGGAPLRPGGSPLCEAQARFGTETVFLQLFTLNMYVVWNNIFRIPTGIPPRSRLRGR
jgi:hypothetical protein